jgi:hypothetical protein
MSALSPGYRSVLAALVIAVGFADVAERVCAADLIVAATGLPEEADSCVDSASGTGLSSLAKVGAQIALSRGFSSCTAGAGCGASLAP